MFAPIASRLIVVDRWLSRVSKGRVVAVGMAPSLLLTTTGRRSGEHRRNPLQYARDGDAYVVVGSNWGRDATPGWVHNLRADHRAAIALGGRTLPVLAQEVSGAEHERLWHLLLDQWPGYALYVERAPHRVFGIFRLVPEVDSAAVRSGR
ncbi:nitroreductase/quinone reductase family protein [Cryptosporangium phraense]|uniref:Nitroreductase family deazaflavin-dependent oxidoreductase n=1 Tax=Cryptosporangium phraense TaxID=2593070 RepID=A0A545AQS6_9ACTN|nr:nitroreductase/quinone reductase family protein [Cryptosporangium phraense]TQS43690.1 nitroreductase family deazaflavin-dependent oxidoreductase [Cryptosporangium phraense]